MNPLFFIGIGIAVFGLLTGTKIESKVKSQTHPSKKSANVKPESSDIDDSGRSGNGGDPVLDETKQTDSLTEDTP